MNEQTPNEKEMLTFSLNPDTILNHFKPTEVLVIKKVITINDENFELVQNLIKKSLENEFITIPIRIKFNDKLKAIAKLKQMGLLEKEKKEK